MSKARYPFEPDYAVAPGETLREVLATMGMSVVELAEATNITTDTIYKIIDGVWRIIPDMAVRLERVTGVRARMWLKMEANYRRQLAKTVERKR